MSTSWNVNKGGPVPSLANVKAANGLVKLQNTTSAIAALTNIKLNKNAVTGLVKMGNNTKTRKNRKNNRKTTRKNNRRRSTRRRR